MREKLEELARLHGEAQKTTWQAGAAREIYAAFPDLLAYVRELEAERDSLRQYQEDETQRRAKADCYDRICEGLGVQSNVLGAISARDAQQRREGAAEALLDIANGRFGDGLFVPDRTHYTAAQVSEILTEEAQRLLEAGVAADCSHDWKTEGYSEKPNCRKCGVYFTDEQYAAGLTAKRLREGK